MPRPKPLETLELITANIVKLDERVTRLEERVDALWNVVKILADVLQGKEVGKD